MQRRENYIIITTIIILVIILVTVLGITSSTHIFVRVNNSDDANECENENTRTHARRMRG